MTIAQPEALNFDVKLKLSFSISCAWRGYTRRLKIAFSDWHEDLWLFLQNAMG